MQAYFSPEHGSNDVLHIIMRYEKEQFAQRIMIMRKYNVHKFRTFFFFYVLFFSFCYFGFLSGVRQYRRTLL